MRHSYLWTYLLLVSSLTTLATASGQDAIVDKSATGESISVDSVRSMMVAGTERYHRILDRSSMSAGVYILQAESTDSQRPHERDEIYYVLAGKGKLIVGPDTLKASPGTALFVPSGAVHRFVQIEERLELLVFFDGNE